MGALSAAVAVAQNFFDRVVPSAEEGVAWRAVQDAVDAFDGSRDAIQKFRDYYEGHQIRGTGLNSGEYYITDWPGETSVEKSTRADRMEDLGWNRVRDGILAHADALYAWGHGRAVSRMIEWDSESEVPEEMRRWLDTYFNRHFWRTNRISSFLWDMWLTAGSERQAVAMLMWMDASGRRLRRFPPNATRGRMRRDGVVWLEKVDNLSCVLLPHPDQTTELGGVIRWYAAPQENELVSDSVWPGQNNTITELVTDDLWLRWRGRSRIEHPWQGVNRYGDVRNVFVVARNAGNLSDMEDAITGQNLLNESLYNGAEITRNHAFPETLYRGYDPPMEEDSSGNKILLKGPNVAHVAQDPHADIIKRGPPANLDQVGVSDGRIHAMLDEALGISQTERSSANLGQLRSGPALNKMQSKSERRRRRKILAAERFEQELFESVRDVTAYHVFGEDARRPLRSSRLSVMFPDDAFSSDPLTEAQTDSLEVQSGIESRRDMIRKRHPDLTEGELDAKVEEIEEQLEADGAAPDAPPSPQERSQVQES